MPYWHDDIGKAFGALMQDDRCFPARPAHVRDPRRGVRADAGRRFLRRHDERARRSTSCRRRSRSRSGATPPSSATTSSRRSARSRRSRARTSSPTAAASSCTRCWRTTWSTSCTCCSTRSRSAAESVCSRADLRFNLKEATPYPSSSASTLHTERQRAPPPCLIRREGLKRQRARDANPQSKVTAMKKFLVLYKAPVASFDQMMKATPEQQKAGMDAWMAWGKQGRGVDRRHGRTAGEGAEGHPGRPYPICNDLGGYSIMQGESKEALAESIEGPPALHDPRGVRGITELMSIPGMSSLSTTSSRARFRSSTTPTWCR